MKKSLLLLSIITSVNCSSFKEIHYFKDEAKPTPNYYRLTVKGHTAFASSRYLSGYFDEKAVDNYFSEITQPEKSRFKSSDGTTGDNKVKSLDPTLEDKRLVMILSSNSDAIATQIGSFVENQKTLNSLASILNRNHSEESQSLDAAFQIQQVKGQILIDLGNELIAKMDENTITEIEARTTLLQYINALAANLGNQRPFASLDEAQQWLEDNRAILLN